MRLLPLLTACAPDAPTWASARQIASLDEAIGGPKAMARPGDFLLENDRVRVAILGARYSMGPSPYGGTIADVDLQRPDPRWGGGHGNDNFAETFATVNMNLAAASDPEAEQVFIAADGSDGAAIVRVDAASVPFLTMLKPLWAYPSIQQPDFRMTTDYILEPGKPGLLVRTTATLTGETPAETAAASGDPESLDVLGLALTSGLAFGDFYLQGGTVDVFAPGIGFDEDKAVYEEKLAGKNSFREPFRLPFVAGVADGVSYGIATADGSPMFVPLFTSSQTAAFGAGVAGVVDDAGDVDRFQGKAWTYDRWLVVGKGDVGSVVDAILEVRGDPYGEVRGYVLEEGTNVSVSGASVLVYERDADKPWSQWLSDVGEDTQIDGSFGGRLPPGEWDLEVHVRGRPDGPRVPVTVEEGGLVELVLASPRAGQVSVDVYDEQGRRVPAKVTFTGDTSLDSVKGDPYVPGGHAEVVFTSDGHADVVLPPGTYTATASRGLEYEIDTREFTVDANGVARLQLQVFRSVETDGWVSADFHVHAIHSFDSGTKLSDRVVTFAAEGVEFMAATDHDFLTDFRPTIEDLGLEEWLGTAVGLETTTLEVGHFLGFPYVADTIAEQGGAFDWTGMSAGDILAELRDMGERDGFDPIRIVAHPRDGILGYHDQFGFDPYTGEWTTPTLGLWNEEIGEGPSDDFEALEILNGKRFELIRTPTQEELDAFAAGGTVDAFDVDSRDKGEQEDLSDGVVTLGYGHEGQVDDWFALLNLGHRYTALGNSDTHGKYETEAGCPRNYVMSETDEPAFLDPQAIADAVREHRVVASYGPFIRFTADGEPIGSEIATDGEVELHVEVQAPTWIPVDRVELYQNGALIREWVGLDPDVYKLVQDVTVEVDADSWFVVVAIGEGDLSPVFNPVEMAPVQLQDVVTEALADVDGVGGFLSPAVPIPREGPVIPYAITNPIWVDVGGDGWTPPGLPSWNKAPPEPE
ncbi:MAG: CehA/McbA family metallohydrolase [Myxococcota bacterium]